LKISVEHRNAVRLAVLPPLALYVHIPWCVRKCPYCDFNSHEKTGPLQEKDYVEALTRNLERLLPKVWGRRVTSVFIGGGTPSLFSPEAIDALLSAVRARLTLDPGAEVTLEANPGTAEAARFRGFREAGVNRISVGAQSFDDAMLQKLGRIHSAAEARRAVDMALEAVGNVNLDLMYGLPGQDLSQLSTDIQTAIRCATPHLSAYQLTIEPNTVFFSKPPALPSHDLGADMQLRVEALLLENGFQHYETSAFAKPDHRCRHNLNYWEFGDYLGIGAGAHGKISFPDRVTRHEWAKQPREFLEQGGYVEREVPASELPFEFMLNALRLVEGFPVALFAERTGLSMQGIKKQLETAESKGLLEQDWQRIRPSTRGRHFLNELLEMFLPERKPGSEPGFSPLRQTRAP
jgi:oxygen-independent coproporphyrinogen-3 oxidase